MPLPKEKNCFEEKETKALVKYIVECKKKEMDFEDLEKAFKKCQEEKCESSGWSVPIVGISGLVIGILLGRL